ncbi:sensor histidine kinase [Methanosarcina sp.]|uniref:sensor histidine kinase n=1 Tax=Methanosarcina sp. TaxID=2213 RepID=UPI002ABB1C1B|nr:histidine kinase dimerization/phosphoacceptor domain -containing protein [Methanosarcina sp.]MDY9927223.1 histidine kinase dimerization/phosphoacceptor domain -containing protein [Methanosarcina sp.]
MNKKVEILLFEDNPGDANLIKELLEDFADFTFELENVETLNEGLNLLKERPFDVILSDLGLPDSDGIDTFLDIHSVNPRIPIIILTGMNDEKTGIDAVKEGAQDYLVKAQVDGRLLNRSIRYSIERKRAEEERQKSEERYRIVTEQTGQLIYEYDIEENQIYWAGAIEKVTGYTQKELLNIGVDLWINNVHPDDRRKVWNQKIADCARYITNTENKKDFQIEYRFKRKDENYIYIEDHGVCLQKGNYLVNKVLGTMKDITERKKAENVLKKIEDARKKEIHHRIKNNLQVISSLLDLQAEKFAGSEVYNTSKVLAAFRDSQNRVISMALIHEELYGSREASTLDFAVYLHKLTEDLFRCYNVGTSGAHMLLEIEEKTFFDMDTAVPLGMIVNELVSNSLKHAFPEKKAGEVQVKLCRERNGEYESGRIGSKDGECKSNSYILTVSDNGVGIPESINLEDSDTLGIQLVTILADQLEGKLELNRDYGTEFCIKFAIEEK